MNINYNDLKDKITACWIGKNIGGTMGAPYEGSRELHNVSGYVTPPNTVLPNDDLDLQLVWLKAVEEYGLKNINERILGEYWASFITGQWNEYGICKLNMGEGLLPPLSGTYNNDWQNSNGAWIRTEIWATMAPACPDVAAKYAMMDACVDHGAGEGTYAAIFVAAMESAAFVISDIRELLNIGLSKIPKDCRMARAVRLVIDCYDNGDDWITTRNKILDEVSDIGDGWFEAPGNVAFVVLGLLYGEGDYKNSMIYAINCGDDTDCTAGTVGALLGIINGTKGLPKDWVEHIGDKIVTCSLNLGLDYKFPATVSDVTHRVMLLIPEMMRVNNIDVTILENRTEITDEHKNNYFKYNETLNIPYNGNYYDIDFIYAKARIVFPEGPAIRPNSDKKVTVYITSNMQFGNSPRNLKVRWFLPEGFTVDAASKLYQRHFTGHYSNTSTYEIVIHSGEKVDGVNRIILELTADGRPTVALIPISLIGI